MTSALLYRINISGLDFEGMLDKCTSLYIEALYQRYYQGYFSFIDGSSLDIMEASQLDELNQIDHSKSEHQLSNWIELDYRQA